MKSGIEICCNGSDNTKIIVKPEHLTKQRDYNINHGFTSTKGGTANGTKG